MKGAAVLANSPASSCLMPPIPPSPVFIAMPGKNRWHEEVISFVRFFYPCCQTRAAMKGICEARAHTHSNGT